MPLAYPNYDYHPSRQGKPTESHSPSRGTASLIFDISFFLGVDATQPVRHGAGGEDGPKPEQKKTLSLTLEMGSSGIIRVVNDGK